MQNDASAGRAASSGAASVRPPGLADIIADQSVRAMYDRLVRILTGLHTDVNVSETGVELRARVGDRTLCRVVPYRELLHVQVGDTPLWEVRVRDEATFLDAVDRVVRAFLGLVAAGRPGPSGAR